MLTTIARQSKMAYYWTRHRARQTGTTTNNELTPITTVSSPWNLGMYLSPLVTSELFRGLKRHITLMVHSAGSAIFHGLRMEIHRLKKNKVYPGCQERPWGQRGRPSPAVPTSGCGKRDRPSATEQKSLFSSQSLPPPATKP